MGRKLPWEVKAHADAPKRDTTSSRPVVHQKQSAVAAPDDQVLPANQRPSADMPSTPRTRHARAPSRTPSTSPPPAPPPISPLRPGYDADDIYMMVEDEFFSIAQSYTAHLHHAEYKRLMRKAKERPTPQQIADLSPSKPRNVRDRVRQDALRKRQKSALDGMTNNVGVGISDDSQNDEDKVLGVEKKVADTWRGTSLAGLMRDGSSLNKTSLIGLERLSSSTRAAKGYSRREVGSRKPDREARHDLDLLVDQANKEVTQSAVSARHRSNADARSRTQSRQIVSNSDTKDQAIKSISGRQNEIKSFGHSPTTSKLLKQKRSRIDELEAGLDEELLRPSLPPEDFSSMNRDGYRPSVMKKEPKSKKSRLDEVPVFLV